MEEEGGGGGHQLPGQDHTRGLRASCQIDGQSLSRRPCTTRQKQKRVGPVFVLTHPGFVTQHWQNTVVFYKHHKSEIGVTEKFEAISGSSPPHVKVGPIPRHLAPLDMRREGGKLRCIWGRDLHLRRIIIVISLSPRNLAAFVGRKDFFDQKFQFGGNF